MTQDTRVAWLKVASLLLLILPGAVMVAGLVTPMAVLVEGFLDLGHWPMDGAERLDTSAARLLNGILGGVLAGFGVLIWQVAEHVFRADPALGVRLILPAALTWVVLDNTGSILAGAWFNAVMNLGFLLILLAPLLWPRP